MAEQVQALARLENEMANFEKRGGKKAWPKVQTIAREAKERTKSELSIAEILMLYGIVSAPLMVEVSMGLATCTSS